VRDAREGGGRIGHALHAGRVRRRPDDDEVVVHDVPPLGPVPFGDEALFVGLRVDEEHVSVFPAAELERLAGAHGDDLDLVAGVRALEGRYQNVEETRVMCRVLLGHDEPGRRGRGLGVHRGGGPGRARDQGAAERKDSRGGDRPGSATCHASEQVRLLSECGRRARFRSHPIGPASVAVARPR
jgi:hypothetical protein